MITRYRVGDRVVFTRDKYTSCPGRRAKNIIAAPNGESYQYQVDKYWIVREVRPTGELVVATRRGKSHTIQAGNPQLRKATLFERLFKSRLFPDAVDNALGQNSAQDNSLNTLGPAN